MSVLPALLHWPPSGAYVRDLGIKDNLLPPHVLGGHKAVKVEFQPMGSNYFMFWM